MPLQKYHDGGYVKSCFTLVYFILVCFIVVYFILTYFPIFSFDSHLLFWFLENNMRGLPRPVLRLSYTKNYSISSTLVSNLIEHFFYISTVSSLLTDQIIFDQLSRQVSTTLKLPK